ncbi:zinc finger transcription factor ace1 [Fusarium beomiforme]|uniref:Zinc finger transcription factor ace1 n=1 Tax=Fusarium beomiforme TaxID=44412 RepID=A0A9P5DMD2_9HYPO|nr:zinc finger transcription factor ace1 [Fusarium beomiforme]
METIANHVLACLQGFNSLCNSTIIWEDAAQDEGPQIDPNRISRLKLQNEMTKKILSGQMTPWEKDLSPDEISDDSDASCDDPVFQPDISGTSELTQIFSAVIEDINCLFRLSVSIHNPSPHDRFKKVVWTDTTGYELFDVQHVGNKFSKAPKPIAERLGKAISRRRQYLKYRELHHQKLASGLEHDDKDQMQSTVASSLPKKLDLDGKICLDQEEDEGSDTERSQTSWATSAAFGERREFPAVPAEAINGPFQCPFCFMMISISSRHLWKKHVFSDLSPYICLELSCPAPDQDFLRRHEWADHPATCPLCKEKQPSFKQYQRHVGRHQEDLALFALPRLPQIAGEEEDESVADSHPVTEADSHDETDKNSEEESETDSKDEEAQELQSTEESHLSYSRIKFEVDMVESEDDEGQDETKRTELPHTTMRLFADVPDIEEAETKEDSRAKEYSRAAHKAMVRDFRKLTCSDDESAEDIDGLGEEARFLRDRERRKKIRRMDIGSSFGKRTHSKLSELSDSGEGEEGQEGEGPDAGSTAATRSTTDEGDDDLAFQIGSSARRMRRKLDRNSFLFHDPPPDRIEDLAEPDSSEYEHTHENLAQELPYWAIEMMEMGSESR